MPSFIGQKQDLTGALGCYIGLVPSLTERLSLKLLHRQGFESRYQQSSVGPMHILEASGSGSHGPMVLLHGFSAASVQYLPLLSRLRPHVDSLMAPDLPAHGFSAEPTGGAHRETMMAGLFETLDSSIKEPVVLFGNSMGGFAAIEYASARPEKVRALILVSPGGAPMDADTLDEFWEVFRVRNHKDAVEFIDRLMGKPSKLKDLYGLIIRRKLNRPILKALIESVKPEDLLDPMQLEALQMPTLVIWGQEDGILPQSHLNFFKTHFPEHAQFEEPRNFGHSPYLEYPDQLTERICAFLERNQAR